MRVLAPTTPYLEIEAVKKPFSLWGRRRHVLPGFHLTLGFTIFYLTAIVLIPLAALLLKVVTPTDDYPSVGQVLGHVAAVATSAEAVDSFKLSFGLSFAAALVNSFFGLITAWVLTRYAFPGRRIADALIDLPFAMPTSVAGIALTQIFSLNPGWLGYYIKEYFGLQVAYSPWGIFIALTFIGFPFVVRTLQPVIQSLAVEVEEAAACLGANRWQTFSRVIFPALRPALFTGAMLAFGRAVGEYGSVVFICGRYEITPQVILVRLEEYDYVGAAGLGAVMLLISFLILGATHLVQHLASRQKVVS